jgi:perosamine synthetase
MRIPLSSVDLTERELRNLVECHRSGWISSKGPFVDYFEELNRSYYGRAYAVATSSGTTALHLALAALGIGPDDEVIVPDVTFAATINAVLHAGATPVIAPTSHVDWNLDTDSLAACISERTRAVIAVHLYGRPCEMQSVADLCHAHALALIEDCAQAHGAEYRGQRVGGFGSISCFSFFANKIVSCGEGGVCLTDDPLLDAEMRLLRNHGMKADRPYWHTRVGYNYRMTNLQAAVGCAQMERIEELLAERNRVLNDYRVQFAGHPMIGLRPDSPRTKDAPWLETIMLEVESAEAVIDDLASFGIQARGCFTPLSAMPLYETFSRVSPGQRFVRYRQGLSLPTYPGLTTDEVIEVSGRVLDCLDRVARGR